MTENKLWFKVARNIIKAGKLPIQVTDTLYELIRLLISEDEAQFLLIFNKKPNLNLDEIKAKTDLKEDRLKLMLENLMNKGIISGNPSKTTGQMIYYLMPPFPGIFELQLMKGESGEKQIKLAMLFDKLFHEWSLGTQKNYDLIVQQYRSVPSIDRVIPIEQEIELKDEIVLPLEEINKIIDKYDDIALAFCYCRQEKELLNDPCKINAPKHNCFMFGKNAQFLIAHGFAKSISKEKTRKIMQEAEDFGLIHKAFHIHQDIERDEEAICNCCNCCCGVFQLHKKGITPFYTTTSYIVDYDVDVCVGCGTCVDKCPLETIEMEDSKIKINKENCIGCGVCVHNCPEKALKLNRTGLRSVFILPPKLT